MKEQELVVVMNMWKKGESLIKDIMLTFFKLQHELDPNRISYELNAVISTSKRFFENLTVLKPNIEKHYVDSVRRIAHIIRNIKEFKRVILLISITVGRQHYFDLNAFTEDKNISIFSYNENKRIFILPH